MRTWHLTCHQLVHKPRRKESATPVETESSSSQLLHWQHHALLTHAARERYSAQSANYHACLPTASNWRHFRGLPREELGRRADDRVHACVVGTVEWESHYARSVSWDAEYNTWATFRRMYIGSSRSRVTVVLIDAACGWVGGQWTSVKISWIRRDSEPTSRICQPFYKQRRYTTQCRVPRNAIYDQYTDPSSLTAASKCVTNILS